MSANSGYKYRTPTAQESWRMWKMHIFVKRMIDAHGPRSQCKRR